MIKFQFSDEEQDVVMTFTDVSPALAAPLRVSLTPRYTEGQLHALAGHVLTAARRVEDEGFRALLEGLHARLLQVASSLAG